MEYCADPPWVRTQVKVFGIRLAASAIAFRLRTSLNWIASKSRIGYQSICGGPSRFPEVLELTGDAATAKSDDPVSVLDRPQHPGLFETRPDNGLAARLDDARTVEQALRPEIRIAHRGGVTFEIFSSVANFSASSDRSLRRARTTATSVSISPLSSRSTAEAVQPRRAASSPGYSHRETL